MSANTVPLRPSRPLPPYPSAVQSRELLAVRMAQRAKDFDVGVGLVVVGAVLVIAAISFGSRVVPNETSSSIFWGLTYAFLARTGVLLVIVGAVLAVLTRPSFRSFPHARGA